MPGRRPVAPWAERIRHRVIQTPTPLLLLALCGVIAAYVFGFGLLCWSCGAVAETGAPDKPVGLWDSVYFSAITAATVGYGDLVPRQGVHAGRVLAGLEAFGALVVLSLILGVVLAKLLAPKSPFVFDRHATLQVPANPGADDPGLLPRFAFRCMNVGPENVHDINVWITYRRQLPRTSTKDFDGFRVNSSVDHAIIWRKGIRQHFYGSLREPPVRPDGHEIDAPLPRGIRPKDALRVYVSAFDPVLQQRVAGYKEYPLDMIECGRFAKIGKGKDANWANWGELTSTPVELCEGCKYSNECIFRHRRSKTSSPDDGGAAGSGTVPGV